MVLCVDLSYCMLKFGYSAFQRLHQECQINMHFFYTLLACLDYLFENGNAWHPLVKMILDILGMLQILNGTDRCIAHI